MAATAKREITQGWKTSCLSIMWHGTHTKTPKQYGAQLPRLNTAFLDECICFLCSYTVRVSYAAQGESIDFSFTYSIYLKRDYYG